jgi:hypothetical protein
MSIQFKRSEILILLCAATMGFLANLPPSLVGNFIDRQVLLSALTALVVIAMLRYLEVFLLIVISILAIGANLPNDLATTLEISQTTLIISLGILITIAIIGRTSRFFHSTDKTQLTDIADARSTLLNAIAKGDLATLHRLLDMNVGINFVENGTTPLHLAAEKGYSDVVQILLQHGANFHIKNAEGKTPLDVALSKKKFIRTTEILFNANKPYFVKTGHAEERHADLEIWQEQFTR